MSDFESMLQQCNSFEKVISSEYNGKSGNTLLYKIEINGSPVEFLNELMNTPQYVKYCVLMKQYDEDDSVYLINIIEDLLFFMIKNKAFPQDMLIRECQDKIESVAFYLKRTYGVLNWNFYFNELTVDKIKELIGIAEKDEDENSLDITDMLNTIKDRELSWETLRNGIK